MPVLHTFYKTLTEAKTFADSSCSMFLISMLSKFKNGVKITVMWLIWSYILKTRSSRKYIQCLFFIQFCGKENKISISCLYILCSCPKVFYTKLTLPCKWALVCPNLQLTCLCITTATEHLIDIYVRIENSCRTQLI